jgi:TIR domain
MADIFISYASQDREKARSLAEALAARGWSAWWDRKIPLGQSFDAVIEKALREARCLIVLWSTQSVESKWVRNEASDGESRGILIPVFIEAIQAPLAFRLLNGANLQDWEPGSPHPEFERLLERVSEMLGQPAGAAATTAAPAELLRAGHERPINQTKHLSWPRVSPARVFAVVVAVIGLISGTYLLVDHRPTLLPPLSADESGKPSGAGTRDTSSGSTSATAPAIQTVPEGPLGRPSTVDSGVGQITLNWSGANVVGWKVLDADRKTTLRNSTTGAKRSDSQDLPPGDYVVTLNATGFQPIPVTVRNGQASTVIP